MDNITPHRARILVTGTVTLMILGLLLWTHFHGGVPSHHILQRADLPGISNWWGGLLLPALTWLLLGRVNKRLAKQHSPTPRPRNDYAKVLRLFLMGLAFAIILAACFTNGYEPFLENVPYLILAMSLAVPIYYAEFMLGFVLGMTYTFGAMIPTVFALIMASIGFLLFRFVRPLIQKVIHALRK